VSFQIPIRAVLFDTTFLRDILPLIIFLLLLGVIAINGSIEIKLNQDLLVKFCFYYLAWGLFIILVWVAMGVNPLSAFREYRNHIFPLMLFFVARNTLNSSHYRNKLINLLFTILMIYLITTIIEYLFIKVFNFFPGIFPWYAYTFLTDDRYITNLTGNIADDPTLYIHPEFTPILGLAGFSHSSAAIVMVLVGFCYPFLFNKNKLKKRNIVNSLPRLSNYPDWICYLIVFLIAFVIFLVYGAKMHMVSFLLLLLFLPIFLKNMNYRKNIIVILFFILIVLSSSSIRAILLERLLNALLGSYVTDIGRIYDLNEFGGGSLGAIFAVNPISAVFSQPIFPIIFGSFENLGVSELRLLSYTLHFGLLWLILYLGIYITALINSRKIISNRFVKQSDYMFACGTFCFLFICFLDMLHYARPMTWPIIDFFAVCIGSTSTILIPKKGYQS